MGLFLENLYDLFFQPSQAMHSIVQGGMIGQAAVAFLLSVLIPLWPVYYGLRELGFPALINIIIAVQVLGSLVLWFGGAAFLHLFAELFGGRGSAAGLLAAMGFAHIPRVFFVPCWVVIALMPSGIRPILLVCAGILIVFWSFCLDITAIRANYSFGRSKAVLVLAAPLLAAAALFLVICIVVGTTLLTLPWRFH